MSTIITKEKFAELVADVHQTAVDHGWWDKPVSVDCFENNVHGEWSEAWDEYAHSTPMEYVEFVSGDKGYYETDPSKFNRHKPEGIAVELIDGCIRIMDWFGHLVRKDYQYEDITFNEDANNGYRSLQFENLIAFLHTSTVKHMHLEPLYAVFRWLYAHGVDPVAVLERKNAYNKTRSYRHGGKVV